MRYLKVFRTKVTEFRLIYSMAVIMTLLIVSCENESQFEIDKTIDFNAFTLDTPSDWTRFDQQGTDTFIGGLTNGNDTLYFDYGYLSFGSLDNIKENSETLSFQRLKIDRHDAKIVKEKRAEELKIRYSVYIDKRDKTNLNRIYGYGLENEALVRTIFLSHRFK